MQAMLEMLRLLRCANTGIAVRWSYWHFKRAARQYEAALDANTKAWTEYRLNHTPAPVVVEVPEYLKRSDQ